MAEPCGYDVIVDRISHDIPFYRSYLKNAVLTGTKVINNPFWWSADDKFFNYALATKLGVAVPPTVLLPHKKHPAGTTDRSMRNLEYPLELGRHLPTTSAFPAFLKPHDGGGWKSVYKVDSPAGVLRRLRRERRPLHDAAGRGASSRNTSAATWSISEKVHVMRYDPGQPHHLRYVPGNPPPVGGAGRAHGGRCADALPRAGLRPEHGGVRGGGRRSVRHRFHEPGAGCRPGIGGAGEFPLDRGRGGARWRVDAGAGAAGIRWPYHLGREFALAPPRRRRGGGIMSASIDRDPASTSESKKNIRPSIR